MTRTEAVDAIVSLCGGSEIHGDSPFTSLPIYRFPSPRAADRAKDIIDGLLPGGYVGAVFGAGCFVVDLGHLEAA